jgi:hypothetical protein
MTALLGGVAEALVPGHFLALVSAALLGGRVPLHEKVVVVAAFAVGIATGLGGLAVGIGETPAGDALLVAAALGGLAAAAALRLPVWLVVLMAGVVGLALGLDSPPDAILMGEAILGLCATATAGIAILAAMIGMAAVFSGIWNGMALRVAGSWVTAVAVLALAIRWAA